MSRDHNKGCVRDKERANERENCLKSLKLTLKINK